MGALVFFTICLIDKELFYFQLLSHELVRNLGLNFAAVTFVTIVFLPNIQMVFMTLFCVVFTVGNVAGYTYFMGLAIDPTVCIIMMLSVGLAVDYCAHVAGKKQHLTDFEPCYATA